MKRRTCTQTRFERTAHCGNVRALLRQMFHPTRSPPDQPTREACDVGNRRDDVQIRPRSCPLQGLHQVCNGDEVENENRRRRSFW